MKKLSLLEGQKFGEWTVIKEATTNKHGKSMWSCICSCGTKKDVLGSKLINNKTKNCKKCSNYKKLDDITNQSFNKWKVIKRDKTDSHGTIHWLCQCECGNFGIVQGKSLKDGHSRQCKECGFKVAGVKRTKSPINSKLFQGIKGNAKTRNIPFNITKEEIYELYLRQDGKCAITHIPIEVIISHKEFNDERTNIDNLGSLDRIDSSKSYEIENIQWVHKTINKMKQDLQQEEFIKFCKLVSQAN